MQSTSTSTPLLPLSLLALVLGSVAVHAQRSNLPGAEQSLQAAFSDDLPPPRDASAVRQIPAPNLPNVWNVTHDEVGDADSIGRASVWLGVSSGRTFVHQDCNLDYLTPQDKCITKPVPSNTDSFVFQDVARIYVPAQASRSMLCHWLTPSVFVQYKNTTAQRASGRVSLYPSITVTNPVLDDPSLINALTGQPFGGRLTASLGAKMVDAFPLDPGQSESVIRRDTQTCVHGIFTRRHLIEYYGLSPAQADRFYESPMLVRLDYTAFATHVAYMQITAGLRLLGDQR